VTIYDPSLGHATGGGWFYWPGTADPDTGYPGDRSNFGFTMKYNQNGTNLRGNLLVIRHLPDGTIYRNKSNALDTLALGEDPTVPMGWAVFSGKATYRDPTMPEPEGNHTFQVYVEDRDEPGRGNDRFWIEVSDKDRVVIGESSMSSPAADHSVELSGGNIVAPHSPARPKATPGVAGVTEGNDGTVTVEVPITLSTPADTEVTLDWATLDIDSAGIAVSGDDYDAASGTVTFAPGETSRTVTVTVLGDTVVEPPLLYGEWGLVSFSNPSANATLDTSFFGLGIFVIIDDDP